MKFKFGAAMAFALISASLAQAQPPQAAQGSTGIAGARPANTRPPEVAAPTMPIDLAVTAAKAAEVACKGFHIGVAIFDQAGFAKLIYISDGTAGDHGGSASRKARTALLISAPSETLNDHAASDPALADKVKTDKDSGAKTLMGVAGGLPVVVNGKVIGAIGVSGGDPGNHDEECASAALMAVQSQLK